MSFTVYSPTSFFITQFERSPQKPQTEVIFVDVLGPDNILSNLC